MWIDIQTEAHRLRGEDRPFVLATVVAYKSPQSAKPGSKAIIRADGSIIGWIGGGCVQPIVIREALKALETGEPKLVSISLDSPRDGWKGVESHQMTCHGGGSLEVYVEPFLPKPELLILGNSPMAQILCGLGRLLDFKVGVADPDATHERFPEADFVLTDFAAARERVDSASYVVVATMGTGDEEGLQAMAGANPKYLGLIASPQKAKGLFQYLGDRGIAASDLDRITCPAGLSLGGETLPEIALSIMGEIVQLRRAVSASGARPIKPPLSLPVVSSEAVAPREAIRESGSEARDPVCGMIVDPANARYHSSIDDTAFYFCCVRCKESFDRAPESFLTQSAGGL